MIRPLLQDNALWEDVLEAPSRPELCHLWWLGQSGFLLKWQGNMGVFDPYLSDSLTQKYAATDKPHVRISEIVVRPELLRGLGWATSSHLHTDHLDAETLTRLAWANPMLKLILPAAIEADARKRLASASHLEYLPTDAGEELKVGQFSFHPLAAAHNTIERDSEGRCKFLGFVIKFGPFSIYHSGDTLWHDSLVSTLLPAELDVALVPINGNLPERRVAGNLNGTEAAALAKAVGARVAVPHHYDLFEFNTASPVEFVTTCRRLGQGHVVPQLGQRITVEAR